MFPPEIILLVFSFIPFPLRFFTTIFVLMKSGLMRDSVNHYAGQSEKPFETEI